MYFTRGARWIIAASEHHDITRYTNVARDGAILDDGIARLQAECDTIRVDPAESLWRAFDFPGRPHAQRDAVADFVNQVDIPAHRSTLAVIQAAVAVSDDGAF